MSVLLCSAWSSSFKTAVHPARQFLQILQKNYVKAWILVKLDKISTKVVGVTFGNRQIALEHLARYSPDRVTLHLVRDKRNTHDKNAVAVVAVVSRKGAFCMGYLARSLSAFIAPLLDTGRSVNAVYKGVKGLYIPYVNYGLAIDIKVIP